MCRDMQNLQRQVADHTSMLDNQRIIRREAYDEERDQEVQVNIQNMKKKKQSAYLFQERMLRALELRNDGIKMEVSNYAGSLKAKDLIYWLNSMEFFFEWKPMIEEKKMKFACTKIKGQTMIQWDSCAERQNKKRKAKIKTWNKMENKVVREFFVDGL